VATDAPGVRRFLAAAEESKKKGLGVQSGFCWRSKYSERETQKRIHDGLIGDVRAAYGTYLGNTPWVKPRQEGWSDLEYQLRNWMYFTWLSGDHLVEQAIHSVDKMAWAFDDANPVSASGTGGRQQRVEEEYGHIYDHFGLDFEYANGVHMMSMCRQQPGTPGLVAESLVGTKGTLETQDGRRYEITGPNAWKWQGEFTNPYQQEHTDLIASIRAGTPLNELRQVADSTLTAVSGRQAAYTGKLVTFESIANGSDNLLPAKLEFGPNPTPPVAIPGSGETM
jgi:predicted dehydrogenase